MINYGRVGKNLPALFKWYHMHCMKRGKVIALTICMCLQAWNLTFYAHVLHCLCNFLVMQLQSFLFSNFPRSSRLRDIFTIIHILHPTEQFLLWTVISSLPGLHGGHCWWLVGLSVLSHASVDCAHIPFKGATRSVLCDVCPFAGTHDRTRQMRKSVNFGLSERRPAWKVN